MSDSATPWMVAHQGFSGQEYWGGLPFPSPGDVPDPGIEPRSPVLPTDTLPSEPASPKYPVAQNFLWNHVSPYSNPSVDL